ncbi:MAG: 30S ribosomal protein S17 [Candidatus Nanoarchaeia archaeon]|nr:30S ribosomal protein S17 [Candidatus Nanoarchaeia archaeon]
MKNIGIKVESPKKECNDKHCPFHNPVSIRGRILVGKVIKINVHKTITIEIPRLNYLYKYERYEKRLSRLKVHKPDCIDIKLGDMVKVVESKPISKTKNFIVIEVLK